MARPLPEQTIRVDPSSPAGKYSKHRTLASMLGALATGRNARGRSLQMHRDNSSNLTARRTIDEEEEEGEGDAEGAEWDDNQLKNAWRPEAEMEFMRESSLPQGAVPVLRCRYVYHGEDKFWRETRSLEPAPVECLDTEYVQVLAFQCVLRQLRQSMTNHRAALTGNKTTENCVESAMKDCQFDAGHPCHIKIRGPRFNFTEHYGALGADEDSRSWMQVNSSTALKSRAAAKFLLAMNCFASKVTDGENHGKRRERISCHDGGQLQDVLAPFREMCFGLVPQALLATAGQRCYWAHRGGYSHRFHVPPRVPYGGMAFGSVLPSSQDLSFAAPPQCDRYSDGS